MRRSSGPKVRKVIFTYPGAHVIASPRDKVHADRARRERELEARARHLEGLRARDPYRCRVCGHRISAPASLARGIGPVCTDRTHHA
jgi:hypothetical protein